ncbi:MAG: AI-2E family transporter [Spirochaetes bacterium]|nr:AI-2E family transporter [Spirochaetota bacterium]
MEKFDIQKLIFLTFFLGLTILLLVIFSPFFSTLLWSLLFYILINPLYQRCLKWIPSTSKGFSIYQNVLAAIFSLLMVALIILPIIFILQGAFKQSFQLLQLVEGFVKRGAKGLAFHPDDPLVHTIREITFNAVDLSKIDLPKTIIAFLRQSTDLLFKASTQMVRNVTNFFITLLFMVFTLFFLLLDGKYLLNLFIRAVPLNKELLLVFVHRFKETTQHLVTGYFLVALYQATAAGFLFYLFHVPAFLLLSLLILFFAFIPMFGAAGIWIPVTVLKLLSGDTSGALLLAALCTFFVSTVDNFLRPLILKDRIKIHPLLIFFSILGAIQYFGFQGVILGPLILIFFFAALDIFLEQYQIPHEKEPHGKDP